MYMLNKNVEALCFSRYKKKATLQLISQFMRANMKIHLKHFFHFAKILPNVCERSASPFFLLIQSIQIHINIEIYQRNVRCWSAPQFFTIYDDFITTIWLNKSKLIILWLFYLLENILQCSGLLKTIKLNCTFSIVFREYPAVGVF